MQMGLEILVLVKSEELKNKVVPEMTQTDGYKDSTEIMAVEVAEPVQMPVIITVQIPIIMYVRLLPVGRLLHMPEGKLFLRQPMRAGMN